MDIDITIVAERRRETAGWKRAEPLVPIAEVYDWFSRDDPKQIRVPIYSRRNYAL